MDFKGISWFGNFCQKLEAMCLELEETVCEDTVKFVESQVQTVGASVKKFYSDVMHDMQPPTSLDSVKVVAGDFSLNPYSCDSVRKKPKVSTKKDCPGVDKQSTDDSEVISGKYRDHISSPSRLRNKNCFPPTFSEDFIKRGHSTMLVEQMIRGTDQISGVETKGHIRKGDHPPSTVSRAVASALQDFAGTSPCAKLTGINEVVSDQIAKKSLPTAVEVKRHESDGGEENIDSSYIDANLSRIDGSVDLGTSDSVLSAHSLCARQIKSCDTSFTDYGSMGYVDSCINSGLDSQMGSLISHNMLCTEATAEDVHTGDRNANLMEDNIFKLRMENIEQFDGLDPDETCVFVDVHKACVASETPGKKKSYKKKICEAIPSKRRAARKQEYEQLAKLHGVVASGLNHESAENVMPALVADSNSKQLPTLNPSESEWELL